MTAMLIWAGFVVAILGLLALDLGVFNKRPHAMSTTEALGWTAFWILLALAFNILVFWLYENNFMGVGLAFPVDIDGRTAALEFLTGFLLEKSLSLDNIFVIALIFTYFKVPLAFQHRILFWGVLGALVFRGVMIAAGAVLLHTFSWMTYVFGVLLLITAGRMLFVKQEDIDPETNFAVRAARRWFPITTEYDGPQFFVTRDGRRTATTLFLVLLMVETTDVMFAVDSIPAIFAVTDDPFIVYTSNVFAILGLRSLYFALAPMLEMFRYLKVSLVVLLAYIGVKMLLAHTYPIPSDVSLVIVGAILGVGLVASLIAGRPEGSEGDAVPVPPVKASAEVVWKVVALVLGGMALVVGLAIVVLPFW